MTPVYSSRRARLCLFASLFAPLSLASAQRVAPAPIRDDRALFAPLREDGNGVATLARRVRIRLDRVPLADALDSIARQGAIGIAFARDLAPLTALVSMRERQVPVATAIIRLLRGTAL